MACDMRIGSVRVYMYLVIFADFFAKRSKDRMPCNALCYYHLC